MPRRRSKRKAPMLDALGGRRRSKRKQALRDDDEKIWGNDFVRSGDVVSLCVSFRCLFDVCTLYSTLNSMLCKKYVEADNYHHEIMS
jgi:hypothetical protein